MKAIFVALLSATFAVAQSQVPLWGQCGGIGYTGPTQCVSGATCVKANDWYSQCQAGNAPPVTTTAPPATTNLPPVTTTSAPPAATVVTVLPLGDSITFGVGSSDGNSYRQYLKDRLSQSGIQIDYIGTQNCGSMADKQCQGHSGATIDQINNFATTSLNQKPGVVLLHAGTNDITQNLDLNNAPNRVMNLVDKIFTAAPNTVLLLAGIIPIPYTQATVDNFNSRVQSLAQTRINQGKRIIWTPMTGLSSSDLSDAVHPNSSGFQKMAASWQTGYTSGRQKGWIA